MITQKSLTAAVWLSVVTFFIFRPVFAQDTEWPQDEVANLGKRFEKVVVIFLENEDYGAALQQPFFKSLVPKGALLTNFFAEQHPSQPNYIAFVSGSTAGVVGDENVDLNRMHIGDLLEKKGLTWKNYAEALPSKCFLGATSTTYARKHVPFISFTNVSRNPNRCARIVSAKTFMNDVKAGTLPTFSFYSPDLNNDGHDTGVAYAAKAMERTFGPLLADPAVMSKTLFVFTFDEDDRFHSNHIFTLMIGGKVLPGSSSNIRYDHYDLLRTIEDEYSLGTLGQRDASAHAVSGIWKD